jgi:hypothetical protein
MEELDLGARTKIKVRYDGQDYEVERPKARILRDLQKTLAGADGAAREMEITIDFIVKCGLPEDVALDMEVEAIQKLCDFLFAKKKS